MAVMAQDDPVDPIGAEWTATHAGRSRGILSLDAPMPHAVEVRARAFVFSDPRSRALVPLIERIAPSDANILVVGETGTGKELVARYIHMMSDRARKPFIAVNCGAFSESLVEGELFGYEKGAFTGAHAARPGWFEAANGGTLFLDEVGDLPLSLQVKLLRVLQEREVVRIGSRVPIPLDIRIIAATNVDLEQSVSSGVFRRDLFYRLKVVGIPLLPLRDRRADILPLARHFLEVYGARTKATRLDISAAAEELLYAYGWPGNIRELENVIHRATLICQDGLIHPLDLGLEQPGQDLLPSDATRASLATIRSLEEMTGALVGQWLDAGEDHMLDRMIRAAVTETFHRCGANQIRTAASLGITRNVVRTYLKNFDLI